MNTTSAVPMPTTPSYIKTLWWIMSVIFPVSAVALNYLMRAIYPCGATLTGK